MTPSPSSLRTPHSACIIIYGHAGVGKTSVLLDIPRALVLDLRGEIVRVAPGAEVRRIRTPDDLLQAGRDLACADSPYSAWCCDGLPELYGLLVDAAGRQLIAMHGDNPRSPAKKDNVANANLQSHHKVAGWWLADYLDRLGRLPVPKLATAHRKLVRQDYEDCSETLVQMNMANGIRESVERLADVVLYVQMQPGAARSQYVATSAVTTRVEQRPGKYRGQVVAWPHHYRVAGKDRFGRLGERGELSWAVLAQRLGIALREAPVAQEAA